MSGFVASVALRAVSRSFAEMFKSGEGFISFPGNMRKKMMRFTIMILIVILPCLVLAATLTVKQDGTGDYTVIQTAIDAANPGDTVLVYPGRYFENLTIQSNDITLMSLEGTTGDPAFIDSTIIDGNRSDRCIRVMQEGIVVRGFSLTRGLANTSGGGILISVSETTVYNCKIFDNEAAFGGGVTIHDASVNLAGVEIYTNYALHQGGGLYSATPNNDQALINFDPINRCSIYSNRAGEGQDIYIHYATSDLDIPLESFSVAEPSYYYATYLSVRPTMNNFRINFDIQNAHHQEIDSDIYVSTTGSDDNDGLSPATALKTIHEAIYRVAADSLTLNTVHILPGEYSRTDNDQIFPIGIKNWVNIQGSGIDATTVIGEQHPDLGVDISMSVFRATKQSAIFLKDMSITSRETNNGWRAISGLNTLSCMHFENLRIHDMVSDYGAGLVYSSVTNARASSWENVIIESSENILVRLAGGISENGVISAFRGKISNCTFRNSINPYSSTSVWALPLVAIFADKDLVVENCVFSDLTMLDDDSIAIGFGGIQYPQQQNHFSFRNCLFSNNTSPGGSIGGIASITSANNPRIDISNCTFAGNQGDAYTLKTNGDVNITNSIFYNDTPYQIKVEPMNGDPNEHTHLTIDHSLVKDGINGIQPFPVPGNTVNFLPSSISDNPLFTGGFDIHDPLYYSLSAFSPCINSGTLDTLGLFLPPYDLAGNWRIWNGRIDMGCYEYGSELWVSNDDPVVPEILAIELVAYPNPFQTSSNIKISIPVEYSNKMTGISETSIDIYNIKGQKVKAFSFDPRSSLEHVIVWDGKDQNGNNCTSGLYIINLTIAGEHIANRKVTLVK
ncbi:MAG: right-handed parallel beta-helix repeat-containing protein [Candidatus Syntrophosphaera sp.]